MLSNVSSSVFTNSESINLLPVVSAEWNQNLFNPPHITVAGIGSQISCSLTSGTIGNVTTGAKPNFTTKSFAMSSGTGSVAYTMPTGSSPAYKVVTYVKTNNPIPVMVTASGKGIGSQYGSEQVEADSLGWTKIITYIGSSGSSDIISSFVYTITANSLSGTGINPTIFFTVPEIYATTYFDYQNHSLYPTEMPFTYFRPGESYVQTGDSKYSFPTNYRKITSSVLSGYTAATYSPVSSIIQNPQFFLAAPPVPVLKNALPTDISPYRYFVSDVTTKSISAIYEKAITTNKLVLKFNTLMTVPTINISIDGSPITVDGSQSIVLPSNADGKCTGTLTLYWNGTGWTKTKWVTMPAFSSTGSLSLSTTLTKIVVTQASKTTNTEFTSYSATSVTQDLSRMHLVEISPRLEIDLTDFVQGVSISKSLDGSNSALPISSLNTNDASITLSGIPAMNGSTIVPIFSSQSDQTSTILSNMLRKNVKFYVNFNLASYSSLASGSATPSTYIPGGVFYSDSWSENDIQDVTVQCFDVSRYLQSTPVPDYVANLKSVFDIITNILDLAGFTDYDYDSLYSICNNKSAPLDLSYYYCNSKDSTIIDALNQIFVAYQIGAYIDEYGIMKFLSLQNILSSTTYALSLSEADITQGGLSVSTNPKPGKISLRYQTPKIKQSPDVNNVARADIKDSPSFIYTTSNDVVWQQQTMDSVGFNYINADMSATENKFNINKNDLLDIFHTFNMSNDGFAFIENEIVSFTYKEYSISNINGSNATLVSIRNNLELSAEINRFIKNHNVGLKVSDGTEKTDYDVLITPTGNITNVQRGLFGTTPSAHARISNLASKGLSEATINSGYSISSSSSNTSIVNNQTQDSKLPDLKKIRLQSSGTNKTVVFPTTETSAGYQTYSAKFDMPGQNVSAAGLVFNMASSSSTAGAYFVELIKFNQIDPKTTALYSPAKYRYILAIYDNTGNVYSWSDVTGECNSITRNFSKIIKKDTATNPPTYSYITDNAFNLKVVHSLSDGTDGENATVGANKRVLSVFINNIEVSGWLVPGEQYDPVTNPTASNWTATEINPLTGMRQKPVVENNIASGTKFGFYSSLTPITIDAYPAISYPAASSSYPSNLREIHATKKPLKERSVSYFYQDREFLNGLVQDQPLYNNSPTYIMQTTPEISGINYYDVQYTTPAAVSVDVLPVEYMMYYFPGSDPVDQNNYQKKLVDEYALAYSTPINTGFRARLAIANGSQHLIFLHREADELTQLTVNLNLWTHEIVAPSDPEIVERVIDQSNMSEVVQLDSEWIQSKQAANKILKVIEMGLEGFSKTVSVNIFGNPLIQVGDIVNLSYNLNGISNQKYLVHAVSQDFSDGLATTLSLKRLQNDLSYSAPIMPPVITSTTYGTVGRVGATPQGITSGTTDNGYYTINLPFSIFFNGQSYSTIHVGTNSYVTFGGGSTVGTSLSPSNPAFDKIMVSAVDATTADGSIYGGVWYESNASSWRIRYQGRKTSESANNATIVWELSSQSSSSNSLTLQVGFTTTGGVTNVSSSTATTWSTLGADGTGWVITS